MNKRASNGKCELPKSVAEAINNQYHRFCELLLEAPSGTGNYLYIAKQCAELQTEIVEFEIFMAAHGLKLQRPERLRKEWK